MQSKHVFFGGIFLLLNVFFMNMNAQISGMKTGLFDRLSDIGAPEIPGTVCYIEPSQTYRITGSGANIWFGNDSFSFLSKKMNGDFILQTQVQFMGEGHELHRKTGIMFRSSTSTSSPMVACTVHGDGLTSLQYRKAERDSVKEVKFVIKGPDVLQLEKKGNTFITKFI